MFHLLIFAEGKFFSNRTDVSILAQKLAEYERGAAVSVDGEDIHWEMCDIWNMIYTLIDAVPKSQRPD